MQKHQQERKSTLRKSNSIQTKAGKNTVQRYLGTFLSKEKKYVHEFKMHYKITFAFIVFFAINLLWYGMGEIISKLPLLRNPIVAFFSGSVILFVSGYLYQNLISSESDKTKE